MNTEEPSPLADYSDYLDQDVATPRGEAVWACVLDKQYGVEVQRVGSRDNYTGLLCVFDLTANAKLIHSEYVTISYGALFGPDQSDIYEWQDKVATVVDNLDKI